MRDESAEQTHIVDRLDSRDSNQTASGVGDQGALESVSPPFPFASIGELARRIESRDISPVELIEHFIARIERWNAVLGAYLTLDPDRAIASARRAETEIVTGHYRGPLHGVPVAHKDVILTSGLRTTAHSEVLSTFVPLEDAHAVRRLAEAGAIVLGKTNTYEFACSPTNVFVTPRNPWDLSRTTGGSSAGSASAVAAALCAGATATETGGSLRVPAAYCGVVGLRPTHGLVSRSGVIPVSWSLDDVGPIARSVGDAALLLGGMAGHDPNDSGSVRDGIERCRAHARSSSSRFTFTFDETAFEALDRDVSGVIDDAIRRISTIGVRLSPTRLPGAELVDLAWQSVVYPETFMAHRAWMQTSAGSYGTATRQRILIGACLDASEHLLGQSLRRAILRRLDEFLGHADMLISPTTEGVAPTLGGDRVPQGIRFASLLGLPAITMPCGFSSSGLPVGIQFVGRPFSDDVLLEAARRFEFGGATDRQSLRYFAEDKGAEPEAGFPLSTGSLRDEVTFRLRSQGVPLFEEDIDPIAARLAQYKRLRDNADVRAEGEDLLGNSPWTPWW